MLKRMLVLLVGTAVIMSCDIQGIKLLNTYEATFTPTDGNRHYDFTVPEIQDKPSETFVMGYRAFSTSPDIWTPISDGWLDTYAESMVLTVSWEYGAVRFWNFSPGHTYHLRLDVYGSDTGVF